MCVSRLIAFGAAPATPIPSHPFPPLFPQTNFMGLIPSLCRRPQAPGNVPQIPATMDEWHETMQRAHNLLIQPRADGKRAHSSGLSPAQRCTVAPLSLALSFLCSSEFAAAVSACRTWHTAGELPSAWPAQPPLLLPGAAAAESVQRCWRQLVNHRFLRHEAELSHRSLLCVRDSRPFWTVTSSPSQASMQHLPASLCSSRIWRHASEASFGEWMDRTSAWPHWGSKRSHRNTMQSFAAMTRLRAITISDSWSDDVMDGFPLLAPNLEALVSFRIRPSTWFPPACHFSSLRVLSVRLSCSSTPDSGLIGLHRLEHLGITVLAREDDPSDDGEEDEAVFQQRWRAFARNLASTIRTLAVKHRLRSCELSTNVHDSFYVELTAPPAADNGWCPLPPLSSFACKAYRTGDEGESEFELRHLILLPSLTALHVDDCPLSALWSDEPRHGMLEFAPAELAQAARTLGQLRTLSRNMAWRDQSLSADDLASLRRCSSLRVLQVFIYASQMAEVVSALDEAARSSAAPSVTLARSSAPLERVCVFADGPISPAHLAPFHGLRCLRQLIFRPPDLSPGEWQDGLFEAIAGHRTLESIELVVENFGRTAPMGPLRLSLRCLRALLATPSLVRIDCGDKRKFDLPFANQQVKLLSISECVALRHVCVHFTSSQRVRQTRGWARLISDSHGSFHWSGYGEDEFATRTSSRGPAIVAACVAVGVGVAAECWRRAASSV